MDTLGFAFGLIWDISAWFFIASVVAAPVVVVVRKARARGKRLFVDEPLKRLGPPPVNAPQIDHRWDAMP